nr:hypothetical protein BaRGS_031318 [Batillaria attramentaria]
MKMDKVRLKAQSLLEKLQGKYGVAPKSPNSPGDAEDGGGGGGGDGKAVWYLVDAHNKRCQLPKTMLFLGSDECDIIVQCLDVRTENRLSC